MFFLSTEQRNNGRQRPPAVWKKDRKPPSWNEQIGISLSISSNPVFFLPRSIRKQSAKKSCRTGGDASASSRSHNLITRGRTGLHDGCWVPSSFRLRSKTVETTAVARRRRPAEDAPNDGPHIAGGYGPGAAAVVVRLRIKCFGSHHERCKCLLPPPRERKG